MQAICDEYSADNIFIESKMVNTTTEMLALNKYVSGIMSDKLIARKCYTIMQWQTSLVGTIMTDNQGFFGPAHDVGAGKVVPEIISPGLDPSIPFQPS